MFFHIFQYLLRTHMQLHSAKVHLIPVVLFCVCLIQKIKQKQWINTKYFLLSKVKINIGLKRQVCLF